MVDLKKDSHIQVKDRKVFGIGMNKTGTTTLKVCLEQLGYTVCSPELELLRCVDRGELGPIFEFAENYDGFQDWPWPLVYKEMDRRYENSKFVLTRRKNSDVWFKSLKKHSIKKGPTEYRKIAYGYEMPAGKKPYHVNVYEEHNEEVRAYFAGREEDFLEVCWEEGDGWEEICGFLGHDVPEVVFPHRKKSLSRAHLILKYMKRSVGNVMDRIL